MRCQACGAPAPDKALKCPFCDSAIVSTLGSKRLLNAGLGQLESNIKNAKEKLKKNPLDPDAHFTLGVAYHKKKLFKESSEHLKQAAKLAPSAAEVFYFLAINVAEWKGWTNPQVALNAKKAATLNPEMKKAQSLTRLVSGIGKSQFGRSSAELQAAIREFQEALKLDKTNHTIYYFAGRVFEKVRDNATAVKMYQQAEKLNSPNPKVYIRLGVILKEGKPRQAITYLEKALKLEPSNPTVANLVSALKVQR